MERKFELDEDEGGCLTENDLVSPSAFVSVPMEDRSKYEKLAFSAGDVSSDSDKDSPEQRIKSIKQRRRAKNVLARRQRRIPEAKYREPNDSACLVGSRRSSQLICNSIVKPSVISLENGNGNGTEEESNKEDDNEDDDDEEDIDDDVDENVDDGIEEEEKSRKYYRVQSTALNGDPVVGHQYGAKPLLLDDELDPETKLEQPCGDPFVVERTYDTNFQLLDSVGLCELKLKLSDDGSPQRDLAGDVFALAPFTKPSAGNFRERKNNYREAAKLVRVSDVTSNNKSCWKYSADYVDVRSVHAGVQRLADAKKIVRDVPERRRDTSESENKRVREKAVKEVKNLEERRVEGLGTELKENPRIAKIEEEEKRIGIRPLEGETKETDLFGSSPFSPSSFSVNLFDRNGPRPHSIEEVNTKRSIIMTTAVTPTPTIPTNRISVCSIEEKQPLSLPISNDSRGKFVSDLASEDLFGSIPFDEFASLQLNERKDRLETGNGGVRVGTMLQEVYSNDRIIDERQQIVDSVAKPVEIILPHQIMLPMKKPGSVVPVIEEHETPRHKREKLKEKSKYQLIDDNHSDTGDALSSSSKLNHKSKATTMCYGKKTPRAKKCSAAVNAAGFSNMSFEDFPSDENEDRQMNNTKVTPFEVIREPIEKRFGSLKRRSNPFT